MPYHVYVFERYEGSRRGRSHYFRNLDEEVLTSRIVEPWNQGTPITYDGRTADTMRSDIHVYETAEPISDEAWEADQRIALTGATDVTNTWVTGPAGAAARPATMSSAEATGAESPLRDHRRVMVVHGRNIRARDAMFQFLRALGLSPIEWEEAVAETGVASPHNLDAVRAAMDVGQAVVVLLTAEDQAGLLPELAEDDHEDVMLRGQPRQNVVLEAGLAMGVDRARTILVELGQIRRASDFDGLNVIRISNVAATRAALRGRLESAGCEIADIGTDWTRPEAGGDFDAAAITWTPRNP